jgi:high-affinity iron transporter
MGQAFLITLREGLEIGLVVAILFRYVLTTERGELQRSLGIGAVSAGVVSLVAAILFYNLVGQFEGRTEQIVEFTLSIMACITLTWMIFWMRAHARELSGSLKEKLDIATSKSGLAIGMVAFAAVAREGFEAGLLIVAGRVNETKGASIVVGGVLGLVIAGFLSYAFFKGSTKLNLKKFFTVTGILLLFVAAGLFAKAMHEGHEILKLEGWIATLMWNVESGPLATGWLSDFLQGMFGWYPAMERVRLYGYFLYLLPIGYLFLRDKTKKTPRTATKVNATASTN